jgi:hypothetical protein
MYINDSSSTFANANTSFVQSSGVVGGGTFSEAFKQKFPIATKPLTVNDIKASANPTSASIVSQATGIVDNQKMALQPVKETGVVITKSNDTSGSLFDNKYVLYGGIGLIAIGLIYFMTQD